jgi:hypothetical protein
MGMLFAPVDPADEEAWQKIVKDSLTHSYTTRFEWFLGSFFLSPSKTRSPADVKSRCEKQLYTFNQAARVDGKDWVVGILWDLLQSAIA